MKAVDATRGPSLPWRWKDRIVHRANVSLECGLETIILPPPARRKRKSCSAGRLLLRRAFINRAGSIRIGPFLIDPDQLVGGKAKRPGLTEQLLADLGR